MNMNAVGIDVSKRKSTVAILRPGGKAVGKPFDVPHLSADFQSLIKRIRELDGETRIVMECTGRYYEPVARELSQAGFFVSAVNPQIIRNFQGQDNPLRKVKTDKADSVKIARYTLDSWANLKQYSLMDELRSQLKTMNRQFDFGREVQGGFRYTDCSYHSNSLSNKMDNSLLAVRDTNHKSIVVGRFFEIFVL